MAALLTSVIDNSAKVSEYIMACRGMGIAILPPDINQGEAGFSVDGNSIRYALTAIKGIGYSVIHQIVTERIAGGNYQSLEDFITRNMDGELNKRVIENLIKAGAMDGLGGNRKQFMSIYAQILDKIISERKHSMAGQMTLFDIVSDEQKEEFDIRLPNVPDYGKEMRLAFEKEVLGIYISGHPLEEYESLWKKNITNTTADFILDPDTNAIAAKDGAIVTIGGIIEEKKIKYTRNDQVMAFLQVEDLFGTIEVIVFPKTYQKYGSIINEDKKVLLKGRVSAEEDRDGKLICESITDFETLPREVWIQFANKDSYVTQEQELSALIRESDGKDRIVIFLKDTKQMKRLPANFNVDANKELIHMLEEKYGIENIKLM